MKINFKNVLNLYYLFGFILLSLCQRLLDHLILTFLDSALDCIFMVY